MLTLEHGKAAYAADFIFYGLVVLILAFFSVAEAPPAHVLQLLALALAGLVAWTAIEYAFHRFLLHGLEPFQSWHARHHQKPTSLIFTPTLISAALFAALIFLPAVAMGSLWRACAFTLGVMTGNLGYSITHHATHHWRAESAWLQRRKRWHAQHHHGDLPRCFGVTTDVWDRVGGTKAQARGALVASAVPDTGGRRRGPSVK